MGALSFPAGCFGKLPQHGDFIRYNASTREMLAFDQWLQQGLLHAKSQLGGNWEAVYAAAPAYHFLYYADNADLLLAGILFPSRDKAERKYPFWVSLLVEKSVAGEQMMSFVPVIFSRFFRRGVEFWQEARQGLEMREIVARAEVLNFKATDNFMPEIRQHNTFLNETAQADFWRGLFGRFEDPRKYLLMKNLVEILRPLRHQELARVSLGLRFPLLADAQGSAHTSAFWLQMSFRLLGHPTTTPVLFWASPDAGKRTVNAHLFLFFRPPSPKSFVHLMQPDLPSDNICELEEEGKDKIDAARQALSAAEREMLDAPALKLDEILMKL